MEETIEELPQTQHVQIARTMFELLTKKKITLNEYLERCAYWGIKTLEDIYFRPLPSKPLKVINYEQLSYSKRQKLTYGFFVDHPGIMRYYEERDKIILENSNSLWRLRTYKKYIPESDLESHEKLDKKIIDFKMKINGYEN